MPYSILPTYFLENSLQFLMSRLRSFRDFSLLTAMAYGDMYVCIGSLSKNIIIIEYATNDFSFAIAKFCFPYHFLLFLNTRLSEFTKLVLQVHT